LIDLKKVSSRREREDRKLGILDLIAWETDAESWYARDRGSWREAFYVALWHELVWLPARSLSPEWLVAAEKLRSLTRDKWDDDDRKLEQ